MFDSILPQQPGAPKLPANLVALLQGLPVTANVASATSASPTPPPPVAAPALPSLPDVASAGPGKPPTLPPGVLDRLLISPKEAGFTAAAAGAAQGQVFDSPWATLASSVLRGIASGAPAFRAQQRANEAARATAALQAHDAQQYRDYINSPEAAKVFGAQVSAARALSDADLGPWLVKNNVVSPVTFSQNAAGQTVQVTGPGATGQPVQSLPPRPVPVGQKVPRTQIVGGVLQPVRDATGAIVYDDPNPAPAPKPAALTQAQLEDRGIRAIAGMGPDDPITDENRSRYLDAVKAYHAMTTTPPKPPSAPQARIVNTDRGMVSIDPVTHKVTQLTDSTGAPIQAPKSAARTKAETDSALVAHITGGGTPAAPHVSDDTKARDAARTANAKAILSGKVPGDKALAAAWLKQHPEP